MGKTRRSEFNTKKKLKGFNKRKKSNRSKNKVELKKITEFSNDDGCDDGRRPNMKQLHASIYREDSNA
jgi:hypothetical protein